MIGITDYRAREVCLGCGGKALNVTEPEYSKEQALEAIRDARAERIARSDERVAAMRARAQGRRPMLKLPDGQ